MLNQQTMEKLYAMRLDGMAKAFTEQLEQPDLGALSFEERLGMLVDRQWTWRENRRLQRLLKNAKLKLNACVEDVDYRPPRGLDKSLMASLITSDWIKNRHNVIITGATGVGKTYLACALANKACRDGFTTFYTRAPRLFQDLAISQADGSYGKFMRKLAKTNLLLIDDLGLAPLDDRERRNLLEVIEDRHTTGSTIVASQLPIENWHETIGDPTIADAILDRLVHNAYKINLKGPSMRRKHNSLTKTKQCEI
jgi:DNA replication protein DnaC